MPRTTIADLEHEIGARDHLIEALTAERTRLQNALEQRAIDPNTYLSYVPSGDAEVDAVHVAYKALASLPDHDARYRSASYLFERIRAEDKEG